MLASWRTLEPQNDVAGHVARSIAAGIEAALGSAATAQVALAGGRTPLGAYQALAGLPLDWARVTVIPTDERCVPLDDPASNEGALRRLFAGRPAGAARLQGLQSLGPTLASHFDLVLLGMGEDGHIASLFPGGAGVEAALDPAASAAVFPVTPAPGAPPPAVPRLTLGLRSLLQTQRIVLLLGGRRKREVLREVLADPARSTLPVAALFRAGTPPVDVIWIEEGA
jgi:6-phosphogluconolactonase